MSGPSLGGELPRHRIWIASRLAGLNLRCRLGARLRLVQDHAVEHAKLAKPSLPLERAVGFGITRLPTLTEAGRREVDVLGVALMGNARGEQPHHMHARVAVILGK